MSSPKLFGYTVKLAGKNALMSKFDLVDAYKQIPTAIDQWSFFGFQWLGKFFFDTTTVFGSGAAPAHFDSLPDTIVNLTCSFAKIPHEWVHRQLDDVPIISPAYTNYTTLFSDKYEEICKKLDVPIAPDCPKFEKAFKNSTKGTVLGIVFDTVNQTWSLPTEKAVSIYELIQNFQRKKSCTLLEAQKLNGKLSDFAQMFDFAKGFKYHLSYLIKKFNNDEKSKRLIHTQLKKELNCWKRFIYYACQGVPLPVPPSEFPLSSLHFISDGAGASYKWLNGEKRDISKKLDKGAASIGFQGEKINFCNVSWKYSKKGNGNRRIKPRVI